MKLSSNVSLPYSPLYRICLISKTALKIVSNIKGYKFSLMCPRLKLGCNSNLKHKSNWNFRTSYLYFVYVTILPPLKKVKYCCHTPLSSFDQNAPPQKKNLYIFLSFPLPENAIKFPKTTILC